MTVSAICPVCGVEIFAESYEELKEKVDVHCSDIEIEGWE